MKPVVRWIGGKGRQLEHILPRIPAKVGTFYEPMAGGDGSKLAAQTAGEMMFNVDDKVYVRVGGVVKKGVVTAVTTGGLHMVLVKVGPNETYTWQDEADLSCFSHGAPYSEHDKMMWAMNELVKLCASLAHRSDISRDTMRRLAKTTMYAKNLLHGTHGCVQSTIRGMASLPDQETLTMRAAELQYSIDKKLTVVPLSTGGVEP